ASIAAVKEATDLDSMKKAHLQFSAGLKDIGKDPNLHAFLEPAIKELNAYVAQKEQEASRDLRKSTEIT
ncbi:MAG TPA: hypothetical protein PLV25_01350, partial [Opitutales bacterium]|nr:hypothetical protein [Opitutales bacterium]